MSFYLYETATGEKPTEKEVLQNENYHLRAAMGVAVRQLTKGRNNRAVTILRKALERDS